MSNAFKPTEVDDDDQELSGNDEQTLSVA